LPWARKRRHRPRGHVSGVDPLLLPLDRPRDLGLAVSLGELFRRTSKSHRQAWRWGLLRLCRVRPRRLPDFRCLIPPPLPARPPSELRTVSQGTLPDAGGALAVDTYTYEYGGQRWPASKDQLLKTHSQPSVVVAGSNTTSTFTHDLATNRLKSVVKSGWTYTV